MNKVLLAICLIIVMANSAFSQHRTAVNTSNKESALYKHSKDSLLIYYSEEMGSSCCPADPKWRMQRLSDFIKQFETANNVKITDYYTKHIGWEGENIDYLTLDELTTQQKIKFINERAYSITPGNKLKDFKEIHTIPTPILIAKEDVKSGLD